MLMMCYAGHGQAGRAQGGGPAGDGPVQPEEGRLVPDQRGSPRRRQTTHIHTQ